MPISFPSNPSLNQIYTFLGVTWLWNGRSWTKSASSSAGNITASSDQVNLSTGYIDLPSGTTAQRPANPPSGAIRYNSSTLNVEYWDPSYNRWMTVDKIPGDSAGGGSFSLSLIHI